MSPGCAAPPGESSPPAHRGATLAEERAGTPAMVSAMLVGLLQIDLVIPGAESLKDRRRVVKSLKDRLHRDHMVSVAEIGPDESPARAILAVACVGSDRQRIAQTLDRVLDKARARTDAELVGSARDIGEAAQLLSGLAELDEEALARELLTYADGSPPLIDGVDP